MGGWGVEEGEAEWVVWGEAGVSITGRHTAQVYAWLLVCRCLHNPTHDAKSYAGSGRGAPPRCSQAAA